MKRIIVKGIDYGDLENSMPTLNKYKDGFGGMSILDKDTRRGIIDCFLVGNSFEVYTACEDECSIKFGGDTTLTYHVDRNSMQEYGATTQTYIKFIVYLKKKFPQSDIKLIGLTIEDKKLLILEKLKWQKN